MFRLLMVKLVFIIKRRQFLVSAALCKIIVIVAFKVILLLQQVQQIVLPNIFPSQCAPKVLLEHQSTLAIAELTLPEKQTITAAHRPLMQS